MLRPSTWRSKTSTTCTLYMHWYLLLKYKTKKLRKCLFQLLYNACLPGPSKFPRVQCLMSDAARVCLCSQFSEFSWQIVSNWSRAHDSHDRHQAVWCSRECSILARQKYSKYLAPDFERILLTLVTMWVVLWTETIRICIINSFTIGCV